MNTDDHGDIAENWERVRERIARAAIRAGRRPEEVRLVAVTKRVAPERIAAAVAAGARELGENYVQEAQAKIRSVADLTDAPLVWHLIGHLQSNKAKSSVGLFSLIHSVGKYQLAQEIDRQAQKRGETVPVLVEVNLAAGGNRAGVAPDDALALAEQVSALPNLKLQGVMGMAPFAEDAAAVRPHFARLRGLWESLPPANRRVLSMGMSGDFEVAVEEGATLVRIGTALFGRREG